jgi:hypothetical protein
MVGDFRFFDCDARNNDQSVWVKFIVTAKELMMVLGQLECSHSTLFLFHKNNKNVSCLFPSRMNRKEICQKIKFIK